MAREERHERIENLKILNKGCEGVAKITKY